MNWPTHLPQNCPPEDSQNAFGEVYRIVDHDPPHPDDFRSWREDNLTNDLPPTVTECQACGLSVYRDIADICRVIKRIPRFKKSSPALGTLKPTLGKILGTPSKSYKSHHTWWIPLNTQPWTIFQLTGTD
jgi:hypothetical protein